MTKEIPHQSLILAGVRKSGTTTLFDMLARHSKIAPAAVKESQFFACDAETVQKYLSFYLGLFDANEDSVLLDGSTWYFSQADAPKLIQQYLPDPRIVLCLRDPASRAFSSYLHMKKKNPPQETRPFDKIIASLEEQSNEGNCLYEAEDKLLDQCVINQSIDANYIKESFHQKRFGASFKIHLSDRRFPFRYFGESCYSHWLPVWENTFGEHLHIVFFEDLLSQPETVLHGILEFSGLNFEETVTGLLRSNETRLPKGSLSSKILAFRNHSAIGKYVAAALKTAGFTGLEAMFRDSFLYGDKECASPEQVQHTRLLLADEYAYWEKRDPHTVEIWGISPLETAEHEIKDRASSV